MVRHIALINPPAPDYFSRAYFCSKVAKARYVEPVTDLVVMSGNLSESGYDLSFIDGIAERCSVESVIARIGGRKPRAAIVMAGSASWEHDRGFIRALKREVGCNIVTIGDLFLERAEEYLRGNPELDAVTLDFTENNVPPFLEGRWDAIRSMVYRRGGDVVRAPRDMAQREYRTGLPRYELFMKYPYRFPFSRKSPYAVLLTDYGCPHRCSFCIQRCDVLGFKLRPVGEVVRDLEYIHRLGYRELWMADLTFGAVRERTVELLKAMISRGLTLPWWCPTRVDVMDGELLALMKRSGCYLVCFGLESASDEILRSYRKSFTTRRAAEAVRMCRTAGIQTVGTFIIGLPEDTRETVEELIRYAAGLGLDYASFNFATHKITTPLRDSMLRDRLADDDLPSQDQTVKGHATRALDAEEVTRLRRRAIRKFYLRPSYLLGRFRHPSSLACLLRQGYYGIRTLME
jgi:radical SAM superfamily enzyme YgiQ (UPF0313 family)